ncbi:SusD/RagB family nutrient-binding outer membrane lipoprotein [Chitinophaga defluvii]|uniref:SusD/RagB family nutrient-binding outer membrane lipoprotein n=1 Tax=Chitinophaga defluvii TaxID=3163343 RepID=A0ABV2T4Q3_9BACT
MRYIHKLSLLLLCSLILGACSKNLGDINVNPNDPETIDPQYLMSNVLLSAAYDYQKDSYMSEPASAGRYITMVRNEGPDKFGWGPQGWDGHYQKLSTIYNMVSIAKSRSQDQYVAIGKILNAFSASYLTDLYGDVPYKEALQLKDGIVHPKYDTQESIYMDLLKQLKEANDVLATTTLPIDKTADMMYGGKAIMWQKFANSLRLRLLLRCSKNYANAFTEMQEILSNKAKYPIFESNADNAQVPYLGTNKDNSWPGSTIASSPDEFDKRKPSKEIVDFLLKRNDPRLPVLVAKVEEIGTIDKNEYVGVPNAIPAPYDYNGGNKKMSLLSPLFSSSKNDMLKASLVSYPEILFILAEGLQKGKITVAGETAESMYYKAIAAGMAQYGVTGDAENMHYYDQALVKYDGTLKQLIGQKWMAGFLKGAEGWFDHRRTGFPEFVLGPMAAQSTIPKRYIYPDNENGLNEASYQEAIARIGGDTRNVLMWYLK